MASIDPQFAAKSIRAGRMLGPIHVNARLDLRGFEGDSLPPGLHCYELDLSGSNVRSLPDDLKVDGRIVLDNCRQLLTLPEGFAAGSISMRNCVSLRALPEGIQTWFLDMTACANFEAWPAKGAIHHGALILRNCIGVRSLPSWITNLSQLDVAGCVALSEIHQGLQVSGWIDVGGSGLSGLPPSLKGTALRWRSVRVSERIAFHPELLTAAEVLGEKNAELRRVLIERMGYLRFAREAKAQIVDTDQDAGGARQLLRIQLEEDEPLVGLVCYCPSTARQYFLRVPPGMQSCRQAAAWMAGYDDPASYAPLVET
ncbi:MAG: DUF6745 domain-containing protein [Verrucomicrobiales bacterium]